MAPTFPQPRPLFCLLIFPFGCRRNTSDLTLPSRTLDFPQTLSSLNSVNASIIYATIQGEPPEDLWDHPFLSDPDLNQIQLLLILPVNIYCPCPSTSSPFRPCGSAADSLCFCSGPILSIPHTWVILQNLNQICSAHYLTPSNGVHWRLEQRVNFVLGLKIHIPPSPAYSASFSHVTPPLTYSILAPLASGHFLLHANLEVD